VVDDDEATLQACEIILKRHGFRVDTQQDAITGRDQALRGTYDLMLLDIRMPGLDGMEILRDVRDRRSDFELIMITGYSSVETAVKAVKLGAFDYLPKPFTADELLKRVRAALEFLDGRRAAAGPPDEGLVGESPEMGVVYALIARVAPTDATVLIAGETGTGKELIANAIHAASSRRHGPFVSVDCSALAPGLLESELFGHVKGSFTGAVATKPGLVEIADRGTLFLDEISNVSMGTQGMLLRFLESNEFRPVGGVETKKVDIRLVAATNRDLAELVAQGTFREDLYYRLNVVPVRLPPLRERPSDIPVLVRHFLGERRGPNARIPLRFLPEALDLLLRYPWPGNVRELKNLVERLIVTVDEDVVRAEHLPDYISRRLPPPVSPVPRTNEELKQMKKALLERAPHDLERAFVLAALRRNDWNVSRAARETGLQRSNFHALMRKHGIRTADFKN
jgi:two-component system NtrC family response regulator